MTSSCPWEKLPLPLQVGVGKWAGPNVNVYSSLKLLDLASLHLVVIFNTLKDIGKILTTIDIVINHFYFFGKFTHKILLKT